MYFFLPDEILKEILLPALDIPDQSFASIEDTSPFAKYERSTSVYLLVCKDWLRVATPLLYNVLVLWSKAQIQALAWALKTTPRLGNLIKKLRIECSYNSSLLQVFQKANALTDLYLSFEVYSRDNVSGICKGIALVQPRRVILYNPTEHSRRLNQNVTQLVEALIDIIPAWTQLTAIILPSWRSKDVDCSVRLKRALCNSLSLQEIRCSEEDSLSIPEFAYIPTIKTILFRQAIGCPTGAEVTPRIIEEHPELGKLVAFERIRTSEGEGVISMSGAPDFSTTLVSSLPSDWLQKCPASVLENIIFYAMAIPGLGGDGQGPARRWWGEAVSLRNRQHLGSVCKRFRAVVRLLDQRYVVLYQRGGVHRLAQQYRLQPALGSLAQSLFIHSIFGHSDDARDLAFILSCYPNLRQVMYMNSDWTERLGNYCFRWGGFSALASCSGPKLVDLQVILRGSGANHFYDPTVLRNFTSLRNFCWNSDVTFDLGPGLPNTAFCNLETLGCITEDETFLILMACLDLPRIRSVRFPKFRDCQGVAFFLKRHGPKLQYLQTVIPLSINIFETCPNLKILSFPDDYMNIHQTYPTADVISCSQKHPLEEIRLETTFYGKSYDFFKFLGDLNLSSFPRLRRIVVSQYTWPPTEHEIRKSCWVPWAERLKNLYDVDMVDSLGKAWIPRLKMKARRR